MVASRTAALVLLAVAMWMLYASFPPSSGDSEGTTVVEIPSGLSAGEVADLLHQVGVIRDPGYFLGVARFLGSDTRLQAGTYAVTPGESVFGVLRDITQGRVVVRHITIPEGYTARRIARLLATQGLVDEERFLDLVFGGYPAIMQGVRLSTLEGYLFPDTYTFTLSTTEEQIIATMLARFQQVVLPHLSEPPLGLRLHEVITLASIVEREAQVAGERPVIASVYLNRLRIGMPLQADPTVIYALGDEIDRLLYSHLQVDSPYNTYIHRGLPPGPIANPGLDSILSVLHPAQTDYLYFVARGDGSHQFSRNYSDHLSAIDRYR